MSSAPVPAPSVPGATTVAPAGSGPDLRAVFSGRSFRLAATERVPLPDLAPLWVDGAGASAGSAAIVFDLWDRGEEVLARQHGAAPSEVEIARLSRWAGERGARLRIGCPLLSRPV